MHDQVFAAAQRRILIVTGNKEEGRSVSAAFAAAGYAARHFASPSEAVDAAGQGCWDGAVVDMALPGMNGVRFSQVIRALCPDMVVVLMSAYHLRPDQLVRAGARVEGFAPKPFRMVELIHFFDKKFAAAAGGKAVHVLTSLTAVRSA